MKKITFLIVTLFIANAHAQIISFTDNNFKNALLNHTPVIDTNGDNEIQISEAEAVTELQLGYARIFYLTEISFFTSLKTLDCDDNSLTSLDLRNNSELEVLNAQRNNITDINVKNNSKLKELRLGANKLDAIDLSGNPNIELIGLTGNRVYSLDVSKCTNLKELSVVEAHLNDLDLSSNVALERLYLSRSGINRLDLSNNVNLTILVANSRYLTSLNLKNGNNTKITNLSLRGTDSLNCVEVDDVNYSKTNWTNVDNSYVFQENCATASVKDDLLTDFSVYPNPVQNTLQVKVSQPVQTLAIYNVLGKQLKKINAKNNIDVSDLTKGVYLLRVTTTSGKTGIKKILKK